MIAIKIDVSNLEAEMARNNISKKDIASFLGCSFRTIYSRFNGESQWTYAECVAIRDHFWPELELDYLFPYRREDNPEGCAGVKAIG